MARQEIRRMWAGVSDSREKSRRSGGSGTTSRTSSLIRFETLGRPQMGCPVVSRKQWPRAQKASQGSVSVWERWLYWDWVRSPRGQGRDEERMKGRMSLRSSNNGIVVDFFFFFFGSSNNQGKGNLASEQRAKESRKWMKREPKCWYINQRKPSQMKNMDQANF